MARCEVCGNDYGMSFEVHAQGAVPLVACSAVLSGARSFAAIGQWAKSAPSLLAHTYAERWEHETANKILKELLDPAGCCAPRAPNWSNRRCSGCC